ncbi:MAG: MBL fold metallo-hydrolase [Gemmatimonadetes bacterium]|nr:MBL fold metallo-hydrolase [Gemmatimonadota bacterium]
MRTFTAPAFEENAYLVHRPGGGGAVAIDPGGAAGAMADAAAAGALTLEAVLLTHAHIDHVEGVALLVRRTGAPVYLHAADRPWYERAAEQAAYFGVRLEAPPPVDHALEDGQVLHLAECDFEVRHVPGHSPGHVLLYAAAADAAFVGDVVFQGSIGRSDLPGGDYRQLMRSIRERVLSLPDETVLYPGHGPATTVGHERVSNPFLVPQYGGGLA